MLVSPLHPEPDAGRRVSRLAVAAALALAVIWLAPPPGASARSFGFGTGDVPNLAIDRGGSAHLVWGSESGVLYCGIIRGGEACGKPRRLYGSGLTAGRPHILLAGRGRLVVSLGEGPCPGLGYCTYVRRSGNDGVSFAPPQAIAAPAGPAPLSGPNSFGDAVYGPGESISYASATSAVFFLNAPLTGGIERRFAQLANPQPGGTGAVLGLIGAIPIVAFADTGEPQTLYWQAYRGPFGLDEAAGWSLPQPIASGVQVLENDAIAGGPRGLFVMYQRGAARGTQRLVVRRFTGGGFGPATPIGEPIRSGGRPVPADLTEDASGRLHAVWIDYRSNRLRAAASTAGGAVWGKPLTIASGKAISSIAEPLFPRLDLAAAPDGLGYAVWTAGEGGHRGKGFDLRAAQLEPPGPHGACRLPNCLILGGKPRRASGNKRFELLARVVSCAPKTLKVEAKVATAPRRGSKARVRLRRVALRLDGGKPREAGGNPPAASFSFPRAARGGRHRLVAKLALSVAGGHGGSKTRKLTLSESFASCP
jgi:hypothetical protein